MITATALDVPAVAEQLGQCEETIRRKNPPASDPRSEDRKRVRDRTGMGRPVPRQRHDADPLGNSETPGSPQARGCR